MKNILNRMKYLAVMLGFLNVLAMSSCKDEIGEMTIPVTGVSLSLAELKIQEGVEYQMTHIITPENATNKQVRWSVSDLSVEDCIAVDAKTGIITPKKPGKAVVTVTTLDGNFSASCNVEVVIEKIPVESIAIPEAYYIVKETSYTFEPAILPLYSTNQNLIWSLENVSPEGCLTIDESTGTITAGENTGTATVKVVAADGRGANTSCEVTIVDVAVPATGITIDKEVTLQIGDAPVSLNATISPENSTERIIEWEVLEPEPVGCVTVENGIVNAVAEGKAKIKVTIKGTNHSDECVVTVLPVTPESGYSIGEDDSWWIYNLDGLKALKAQISSNPSINAKLVKDIDLGTENWTPIGSESSPYKGIFDGNGKKISNLNIKIAEKEGTYQGLFASLDGATVQNLGIESGSIDAAQYIGSIAGSMINNSAIINCYNKALVTGHGNSENKEAKAGGIVGYCKDSQIIACYNEGEIGKSSVTPTVTNCDMGGIVGNITGASNIIASYNRGPLTQTGGPRQGGIAGKLDASTKLYGVYNVGLTKKDGGAWGISGGGSYSEGLDEALLAVYWVKVEGSSATAGCKFDPDPSKNVEADAMNSSTVINAMNDAIQSSGIPTAQSYEFIAGSGDYPYPVLIKK